MKTRLTKSFLAQTLLISHLASSEAFAQAPAPVSTAPHSQTNLAQIKQEEKKESAFNLGIAVEYSQKIAVDQRGARKNNTDFTLAPTYKINSLLTLGAKGIMTKENSGSRQTTFSNTQLSLGLKGIKFGSDFESLHSLTGTAATNEASQKRDRLNGAIGVSNGIRFINPLVKIEYKLGLSKNFHEFNINAAGSPNVEYRLSNSLDINVPITQRLSISTVGIYRNGLTYGGFQRNLFSVDADINYDLNDKFSLNLGVSNDGDALKSNGIDSNISAYNENTSVVRAGLSLSL